MCLPVRAYAAMPVCAVSARARRMRVMHIAGIWDMRACAYRDMDVRSVRISPCVRTYAHTVYKYTDRRCVRICARVRVCSYTGVRVRGVWGWVSARMRVCSYVCAHAGSRLRDNLGYSSSPLRLVGHTHMLGGSHMRVHLHVHTLMRAHCAYARLWACARRLSCL